MLRDDELVDGGHEIVDGDDEIVDGGHEIVDGDDEIVDGGRPIPLHKTAGLDRDTSRAVFWDVRAIAKRTLQERWCGGSQYTSDSHRQGCARHGTGTATIDEVEKDTQEMS